MLVTGGNCAGNTSGVLCTCKLISFNFNQSYVGYLGASTTNQYTSDIYFFDIAANGTSSYNITLQTSGTAATVLAYRKEAFPFRSNDANLDQEGVVFQNDELQSAADFLSPPTLYLRTEDIIEGGRYYFAVINIESLNSSPVRWLNYTVAIQEDLTGTGTTSTSTVTTSTSTASFASGTSSSTSLQLNINEGSTGGEIAGIAVGVVVGVVLLVIIGISDSWQVMLTAKILLYRKSKRRNATEVSTKENVAEVSTEENVAEVSTELRPTSKFQLKTITDVTVLNRLGGGNFGDVYKGIYTVRVHCIVIRGYNCCLK